jgi:hypothetical protein
MVTIRTNNIPRELIDWSDLTNKEQAEFNYVSDPQYATQRFFRYRGWTYDVQEFMSTHDMGSTLRGWDGYSSDSYFSGILVKLVCDCERVIVGSYYS